MRSRAAVLVAGCCAIALLLTLTVGIAQTVATVQTDKLDYRPGETAVITGNGFGSQELVTLQVTHVEPADDDGGAGHEPWTVTSDAQGHFETTWYVDPDDSVGATFLLTAVSTSASAQTTFTDAAAATIDQCRNGDALAPNNCAELGGGTGWVNGNAGTQTSHYVEGYSIPYRTVMTQIPIGQSISIDLGYDVKHSGAHAVDFLTHFQRLESHAGFGHAAETVFPISGVTGVSSTVHTFPIPDPSTAGSPVAGQPLTRFLSLPDVQRVMTLYGGTITGITYISNGSLTANQSETVIRVTFTPDSETAVLAWGGHIGRAADWGEGNSAGGISGSPYHMRVKDWRCEDGLTDSRCDRDLGNLGNQDRSLSADAVFPTGTVIITKQIADDGANNTFNFSSTGLGAASFPLTTVDPDKNFSRTFTEVLANRPISVTELAPPTGWEFVDLICQDPDGGTTTSNATRTATIDLDGNETVECTFTNRENVTLTRGQIIVQKVTDPASDTTTLFEFTSDYAGTFTLHGGENHDSGFIAPGPYSVSESATLPAGWALTSASCASSIGDTESPASIELDAGEVVTCTFTNTKTAHLKLVKTVTNDNGGSATVDQWMLIADGLGANDHSGNGGFDKDVMADTYQLSESAGPAGYAAGSWSCTGGGTFTAPASIALTAGQSATCTINNNDKAAHLKLVKSVINDNGGTAIASDWTLTADGAGTNDHSGAGGFDLDVNADTYALSESAGPAGYAAGSFDCGTGPVTSVTVALGESKTCTIVNNDKTAHLTLVKTVTNDNGGTAAPADWTLTADGAGANDHSGPGGFDRDVNAGTYALSESGGPTGYTAGSFDCGAGPVTSVILALGESKTCTINNDDKPTHLKLVKKVTNDNGGTAAPTDWTLTADGAAANDHSGAGGFDLDVTPDTYALSESAGPAGYTAGSFDCGSGPVTSVTLALGDNKTCTIVNDDKPTHLKLVKTVVNDNGGTAAATSWTLTADGTGANDHAGAGGFDLDVTPDTYALSESTGPAGYTAGSFDCGSGPVASVTLALGDNKTCTIVNDDKPTHLKLVKTVVNDNGGTATASSWTLTADGSGTNDHSGAGGFDLNVTPDTYALSESTGPAGYTAGSFDCGSGPVTSVTLALGDDKTCTIVNDDKTAHLKLIKTVVNNNGGTAVAADWTLSANGAGANDHAGAGGFDKDVHADTYALSESGPSGYSATGFNCGGGVVTSVTLALGESKTCTITNDDIAPKLTLVKIVVNDHGGTKQVGDFPLFISGNPAVSGTANTLSAGSYTASETSSYGYTASGWTGACAANGSVTLSVGDDKTCTITNDDQPGKIVIIKSAKPATGSFAFTTTGTGYAGFTLTGATTGNGNRNEQALSAGSYAVTESTQLGWVLTGIGGSTDPLTPYNCVITGSGGSTGVGDLATRSAAISLKNGDTVTCTFENTGNGATRTQGFWATHPQLANIAWFGGTAFGHTFPGVAATPGLGDALICGRSIDTLAKTMGAFWSDVPRRSDGTRRTNLDQNRMQLLQQLIAAELNASAFGSVPAGGAGAFAAWEAALCGTSTSAINQAQQQAGAFNSSGDTSGFTPGTSADSRTARAIADRPFWDIIRP